MDLGVGWELGIDTISEVAIDDNGLNVVGVGCEEVVE